MARDYFVNFTKKIKFLFINLYLNIIKNKQKIIHHQWLYLKKIKISIASSIKDKFIKKYVLEYFLDKIFSLTPHITLKNKKFF